MKLVQKALTLFVVCACLTTFSCQKEAITEKNQAYFPEVSKLLKQVNEYEISEAYDGMTFIIKITESKSKFVNQVVLLKTILYGKNIGKMMIGKK